ncbi:MAG: hypothetical protein ABS69_00105 [Nitrosomonadales bacterium SCN 54-20]|nr:MAG: hypothetical protein ABS69_00105 [Nitrosomonadales bacterium SCN 54-20]
MDTNTEFWSRWLRCLVFANVFPGYSCEEGTNIPILITQSALPRLDTLLRASCGGEQEDGRNLPSNGCGGEVSFPHATKSTELLSRPGLK